MESCLLTNFIFNKEIKSCCDFNQFEFQDHLVVYEVLRVIDGKPLFLEEHIIRFFKSLELNKLNTNLSERQIKSRLKALIEINKLSTANIRFQLSYNTHQSPTFYAWVSPFFYPSETQYKSGVKCSFYCIQRPMPNAKLALHNIRGACSKEISTKKVFEVILYNAKGEISEGSKSNLFLIKNNMLHTAPGNTVLQGVTRSKIIDICNSLNIKIEQRTIMKNEVMGFETAFLSGTSINLLAINSLESISFKTNNQLLKLLTMKYEELINNNLNNFAWNL